MGISNNYASLREPQARGNPFLAEQSSAPPLAAKDAESHDQFANWSRNDVVYMVIANQSSDWCGNLPLNKGIPTAPFGVLGMTGKGGMS